MVLSRWQSFTTGILMFAVLCEAYSSYRQRIPNGSSVPNSCTTDTGDSWRGVGHENPSGGGAKNDFGLDFAQASHTWTVSLCNSDSDGDGVANGVELGDPDCVWTQGDTPAGPAISHPAICEPVNSQQCKQPNSWVASCPAAEVTTPAPTTTTSSTTTTTTPILTTTLTTTSPTPTLPTTTPTTSTTVTTTPTTTPTTIRPTSDQVTTPTTQPTTPVSSAHTASPAPITAPGTGPITTSITSTTLSFTGSNVHSSPTTSVLHNFTYGSTTGNRPVTGKTSLLPEATDTTTKPAATSSKNDNNVGSLKSSANTFYTSKVDIAATLCVITLTVINTKFN